MLAQLKDNLLKAQNPMKKYVDFKRVERHFKEGDMVYLKMEPDRMETFGLRVSIKLQTKFYGPLKILNCQGKLVRKLLLPEEVKIHPVFHVSQLKQYLGEKVVPSPDLPLINEDG